MDAGVQCNKEMVDLLMRMKKHLKIHHQVALNLSDRNLLDGLLKLATVEDDILQGMMRYLMALAGGDWNDRYLAAAGKTAAPSLSKTLVGKLKAKKRPSKAEVQVDTVHTVNAAMAAERPVRYYRGQPVYS